MRRIQKVILKGQKRRKQSFKKEDRPRESRAALGQESISIDQSRLATTTGGDQATQAEQRDRSGGGNVHAVAEVVTGLQVLLVGGTKEG